MDEMIRQLEQVLREQAAQHDGLLEALRCKRGAIARADHAAVTRCCREENGFVQKISELEKQRLQLVAELTQRVDPAAGEPMRLDALAQRLDDPARGRLLVLRQQVRDKVQHVRTEAGVVKRASEALVAHMQGLIHSVASAVAGVATYDQRARSPQAATALSTFNTTA